MPADVKISALPAIGTPATSDVLPVVQAGTTYKVTVEEVLDQLAGDQQVYGSSANTACEGNDSRLSNARTPTAHASTHGTGQSDPITIAESQVTGLVSDLSTVAAAAAGSVQPARQVISGAGLTGGGDLSADRTLAVGAGTGIQVNADDIAVLYGTSSTTACVGNDARLSDTRTPSAHEATHLDNGSDPIPVATTARTGLAPVLPTVNPTDKFLRGDGTYAVPPGSGSGITELTGDVTAGPGSGAQAATVVNVPAGVTAAGRMLHTAITAPSTPGAGVGSVYVDSTSKNLCVKDDAGVVKHGIKTKASVANSFVTAVDDDGTVTVAQPSFSNISGTLGVAAGGTGAATLAAHGVVIGNGTGAVAVSGAGTSGQVLTSNGPSADPTFQTGGSGSAWELLSSSALPAATSVNFTGLAAYTEIFVIVDAVTFGSSAKAQLRVSIDNGSNFKSASGDYLSLKSDGTTISLTEMDFYNTVATAARKGHMRISGININGAPKIAMGIAGSWSADGENLKYITTTSPITAVQVLASQAFTGGTCYVFGRK